LIKLRKNSAWQYELYGHIWTGCRTGNHWSISMV